MIDLAELTIDRTRGIKEVYKALEIVSNFIKKNKLIVYGGMAIDAALRLKGSKIYEDYEIPDYDFYSPNNVIDSYEIFKQVSNLKIASVSVLPAYHPETMRVRFNHIYFIADLTYVSPRLYQFNLLSSINYEGILYRCPYWQYSDQCRAMSYPFEIVGPMPTILHRFKKDMTRFIALYESYPADESNIKKLAKNLNVTIKPYNFEDKSLKSNAFKDAITTGIGAYYVYKCINEGKPMPNTYTGKPSVITYENLEKMIKLPGNMVVGRYLDNGIYYVLPENETGFHEINGIKITTIQFTIIYFYSLMLKEYKSPKKQSNNDSSAVYMGIYFDLLRIMYEEWTKPEVNPIFLPSLNVVGQKAINRIEKYIEENPDQRFNIKPPQFHYLVNEDNKDKIDIPKTPEQYKYPDVYDLD